MTYWKTTFAKIVLDSDQLLGFYYKMHRGQYIQIHIDLFSQMEKRYSGKKSPNILADAAGVL